MFYPWDNMDLNEIAIFAHVVRAQSFTAAAKKLSMPKSTVSRKLSELETRLGTQLLQRSTRKLALTDAGRAYYSYAARIVDEIEEADLVISRLQDAPRGLLRVTAPLSVSFLGPIVRSFLKRYEEVQVEMVCTDRVVDLVSEGFDVGVRAGRLADSTLIARSLCFMQSVIVASPAFVKKHGAPKTPADLARLPCLVFGAGSDRATWRLTNAEGQGSEGEVATTVSSRLTVNDMDMLLDAAKAGSGAALLSMHLCMDGLRQKHLVRLLPAWSSRPIPLHAVYPGTRLLSPKVKAFVEHFKQELTPPPWELGPKL